MQSLHRCHLPNPPSSANLVNLNTLLLGQRFAFICTIWSIWLVILKKHQRTRYRCSIPEVFDDWIAIKHCFCLTHLHRSSREGKVPLFGSKGLHDTDILCLRRSSRVRLNRIELYVLNQNAILVSYEICSRWSLLLFETRTLPRNSIVNLVLQGVSEHTPFCLKTCTNIFFWRSLVILWWFT